VTFSFSSLCVYCGSSQGVRPEYAQRATELGTLLGENKVRLVYGGGHSGLMGVIADAVLGAGGEVIGVIPETLLERELGHGGLSTLHVVRNMHERKFMMADLSDAFVALPGGWGTLEELTEMVAWAQLGFHDKPVGLLNTEGYFDGLLAFIEHINAEGFVHGAARALVHVATAPRDLLGLIEAAHRGRSAAP
jgi:uncharacterized protein (TIGR00730 family)